MLLFFALAVAHPAFALLELSDWQCGNDEWSRRVSYSRATDTCPTEMFDFNHCCVVHDECYANRRGQANCDDKFCLCGEQVTKKYNSSSECFGLARMSCSLVRQFGGNSYNLSYQEPEDMVKYLPANLSVGYEKLYTSCPLHNATTSSCALMYNHCSNRTDSCRQELCSCVKTAYEPNRYELCRREVEGVCHVLVSPKMPAKPTVSLEEVLKGKIKKLLHALGHLPPAVVMLLAVFLGVICAIQKRAQKTTPSIVYNI